MFSKLTLFDGMGNYNTNTNHNKNELHKRKQVYVPIPKRSNGDLPNCALHTEMENNRNFVEYYIQLLILVNYINSIFKV